MLTLMFGLSFAPMTVTPSRCAALRRTSATLRRYAVAAAPCADLEADRPGNAERRGVDRQAPKAKARRSSNRHRIYAADPESAPPDCFSRDAMEPEIGECYHFAFGDGASYSSMTSPACRPVYRCGRVCLGADVSPRLATRPSEPDRTSGAARSRAAAEAGGFRMVE